MQRGNRAGAVLLEVIVAMTILAVGGIAMVVLASESLRAVARAHAMDAEMARASAFFDAVTLWPREDLDRHLGSRPQGTWRLHVMRPTATLYVVTLTDSTSGRELLRTALYRAEAPHEAP